MYSPLPPSLALSLSLSTRCLQLMYGNEREKSVRDQRRLCGAHALIRRLDLSAGPAVWPRGREGKRREGFNRNIKRQH